MGYKLQDLIDIAHFQSLQERLNEIYSFPSAIIDNEGRILTATAWQDVCVKFHRVNRECEKDCIQSDRYILSHMHEANPAVSYRCPRGLVDNATPIIIDGIHYGNFFTGQFFLEEPDLEFFRKQARRFGFDEKAYLQAVEKVPVWTQEQLNSYLFFIKGLIAIISESGLKNLKELEARNKIEESEERANAILLQMHDGFWITNSRGGQIVDVNEAMCRMLGYRRDEMLRMSVADVEANDSQEDIDRRIGEIIQNGSARFESRFRRRDGSEFDVDVSVTYLPKRGLFFGFHRDISERKRAAEELKRRNTFIEAILENAPIGFAVNTIHDGQRVFVSSSFESIYGVPPGSISSVDEYFEKVYLDPVFREQIRERIMSDMATGDASRMRWEDIPITTHRGERKIVTAINIPLLDQNLMISTVQDVTKRWRAELEKRNLEERLQRAEKMEALGKLAGGVAHDLNNVLGVLSGYSELLMERLPEDSPLREYAANIVKSSGRGAAIIQDLLTLARRGVMVSKVVDINGIIAGLLSTPEFARLKAQHPHVAIRTDLENELLNIKGSSVHLEKTVMNLVSNAAEAIASEGEIVIRTENRYLDGPVRGYDRVEEGEYVVLTVTDTGCGIPAADFDKIFEPFYTRKSMGKSGTGLGLAIVWGTVKDHDGYIDVQSKEGEGTTFTLYFPLTREMVSEEAQKIPMEQYMGRGESVLVVDDVEEQRQVASTMLTRLGYRVKAVAGGEEAVEYLRSNSADILVLDMIMEPGIDGLETYRRITENNPRQKAVIVSGFSMTESVRAAQKLGAGAYVKKPYLMEKVGLAIREELARK